jgi:hypothetical protein
MSAWTVSKAHIDILVQALIVEDVIEGSSKRADYVGKQLWAENYRSVNIRYGERNGHPPYRFQWTEGALDDAVVLRSIACYHYQCMEWEGFESVPGWRKLAELRRRMIVRLGIEPRTDDYGSPDDGTWAWCDAQRDGERLPWGIDRHRQGLKIPTTT